MIRIDNCQDITVSDCQLVSGGQEPALSLQGRGLSIVNNAVLGGIWVRDGSSNVRIAGNEISEGGRAGVTLEGLADGEQPLDDNRT